MKICQAVGVGFLIMGYVLYIWTPWAPLASPSPALSYLVLFSRGASDSLDCARLTFHDGVEVRVTQRGARSKRFRVQKQDLGRAEQGRSTWKTDPFCRVRHSLTCPLHFSAVGYIVKLIHIPVNNILVGGA